jgi:hypothetical protein
VIWTKTDAGRIEMQARALVKERAQRNLLLVIDGIKTEEMLLANLAGISPSDFQALQSLGLIVPVPGTSVRTNPSSRTGAAAAPATAAAPAAAENAAPLDYAEFTAALTQIISKELGLRGFTLTLGVEKASTIEELRAIADKTIEQLRDRKGEAAAAAARRTLYGA